MSYAASAKQGKIILLITHDLELARNISDDIAVLYLGRVMEYLPAHDLLSGPQHPYTLALARSFPGMDAVRDLGGIRGDAFYRLVHAHSREGDDRGSFPRGAPRSATMKTGTRRRTAACSSLAAPRPWTTAVRVKCRWSKPKGTGSVACGAESRKC